MMPTQPKSLLQAFVLAVFACHGTLCAQEHSTAINYSETPASRWQDALVSGNGSMGILVHGDPKSERIIFNHEMLYEFLGTEDIAPADTSKAMPAVKQMIRDGKYYDAYQYALKTAFENGHPDILWTDPYHPACALTIQQQFDAAAEGYRRTTNYFNGQISVTWEADGIKFTRDSFVSRADDVIASKIASDRPGSISLTIGVEQQIDAAKMQSIASAMKAGRDPIGKNLKALHPDRFAELNTPLISPPKLTASDGALTFRVGYQIYDRGYEVITIVRHSGGTLQTDKQQISISEADQVEIFSQVVPLEIDAESEANATTKRLRNLPQYDKLLDRHTDVHADRFGRVKLTLNKTGFNDSSNEALIAEQKQLAQINPYLLEKVFHMGLYGLVSSSGENPPNLMGIWNGEWRPKWSGDFTLDANVNLQISAACLAGQTEAIDSYMKMLERIAPDWETNAQNLFGCRGYLGGTRTSGRRGLHTHFGKWPGNHWTAAAGWLLSPCFEYYQCTGDREFLAERLLPMMEKTALFYEDFLDTVDENGNYFIAPSYSPENAPSNLQPRSAVTANAAMDIAVIRELLTNLITASNDLQRNQDQIAKWKAMLDKLPPYLINEDGALKEWAHPDLADRYDHRHVSHLYPAWPSLELTPEDKRLFDAAVVAIQKRGRGNGSAHGLAHTALIAARLKQSDVVYGNLLYLLKEDYFYSSLFTSHNPGIIYNSDALHSIPAVIMEMLVYSRPGVIELLPACSPQLPRGKIEGVMCRTQARIDSLQWDFTAKQVDVTITSAKDQTIQIQTPGKLISMEVDSQAQDVPPGFLAVEWTANQTRTLRLNWDE